MLPKLVRIAPSLCFAMLVITASAFLAVKSSAGPAQANDEKEFGLPVGERAPVFRAVDQFGKEQSAASVAGKNGTVLLFFRSADW
jgi:hypothetical protein